MNEGLIKKIVWLLFTLLGVALVISIAPALTMLLMAQFGMSPTMLILLLFMFSHFALATPAAAPPTGIFYTATEIVKPGDLTKVSLITLPLDFAIALIIGIPYAGILF